MKIFMACSGLGRIHRGFESFMRSCYDALGNDITLDIFLFKGAGKDAQRELSLWNLFRYSREAVCLGRAVGRSGYFIEQLSFFLSFLPHLVIRRPDILYVSDVVLANLFRVPKRLAGYRILYNNNGPTCPEYLHRWDHIQQVSPQYFEEALKAGVPEAKQTLLPSGVPIPIKLERATSSEKAGLKRVLKLPERQKLLLSVGAINTSRKRMDYLIREVSSIPEPRPFLLVLGAMESESEALIKMGHRLLPGGFDARSVEKTQVYMYYRAADVFVLASMDEGFGLAYVEALSHGLPCLVHDYPTSRFVLGELGIYGDLSKSGELAGMISRLSPEDLSSSKAEARHLWAYEQFSWDLLKPRYIEMFRRCARSM